MEVLIYKQVVGCGQLVYRTEHSTSNGGFQSSRERQADKKKGCDNIQYKYMFRVIMHRYI